jgi:DNA-directed RNA polymerase subunit M/transcription elongation factor TFIIS
MRRLKHIYFSFLQRGGACFKYLLYITRIARVRFMSYCSKCGNKVEENMTFCPRCGAPLKAEAPTQVASAPASRTEKSEKGEKQEKNEKQEPEKGEKHEKGEFGFIGWLIGGLILILIGFFALLRFAGYLTSGLEGGLILLVIGVIVIIAAVYFASMGRRRSPPPS